MMRVLWALLVLCSFVALIVAVHDMAVREEVTGSLDAGLPDVDLLADDSVGARTYRAGVGVGYARCKTEEAEDRTIRLQMETAQIQSQIDVLSGAYARRRAAERDQ